MEINPPSFPDKKILIAEDDPLSKEIVKRMLELCQIAPDIAENGEDALNLARAKHYDMIIMDIHMPKKTGIEVTQEIRSMSGEQPLIIALTASVISSEIQQIQKAGFDGYLRKPIEVKDIFELLEKYFSSKTPS
jgi:CheY-like chemotaxis protein